MRILVVKNKINAFTIDVIDTLVNNFCTLIIKEKYCRIYGNTVILGE